MADNDVRINVTANDKASRVLKGVGSSFTELKSALSLAQGAVQSLQGAYEETVGKTVAYAGTVRELTTTLGISSQEASTLIQVFDDFGLSATDVQRVLNMAVQRGFQPTIEGLAGLADQLNAIADPTERAAAMQEVFGKQWSKVAESLSKGGQGFRDLSKDVEQNLILTGEQVAAAREFELTVDELNDSLEGLKVQIGSGLIPVLTKAIEVLPELNSKLNMADAVEDNSDAFIKWLASMGNGKAIKYLEDQAQATIDAAHSTDELTREQNRQVNMTAKATPEINTYTSSVYEMQQAQKFAAEQIGKTSWAEKEAAAAAADLASDQSFAAQAAIDLKGAQENLEQTMQSWNNGAANDMAGMLKTELAGNTDQLYQALGTLDSVMGTNELTEQRMNDQMAQLVANFKKTGDVNAFKEGVGKLKDEFQPLDENVQKAKQSVQQLKQELDTIKRHIDVTVHINKVEGDAVGYDPYDETGTVSGGGTGSGRVNQTFATGGSFTVPPGYPNDTYKVGLTSGENVEVTPAGQTNNHNYGGVVINVNGSENPSLVAQAVRRELEKISKQTKAGMSYAR